jgi:lambda repressor-like predicted transcriptional regulator
MARMNRVREVAKLQGRKLVWLGVKIKVSRAYLDKKLDLDRFTPDEQEIIAEALGVSADYLFPDEATEAVTA